MLKEQNLICDGTWNPTARCPFQPGDHREVSLIFSLPNYFLEYGLTRIQFPTQK